MMLVMETKFDPKRLAALAQQREELIERARLMNDRARDANVRVRHLRTKVGAIERELAAFLLPQDRVHGERQLAELAPQLEAAEADAAEARAKADAASQVWQAVGRLYSRCVEFAQANGIPLPPPALQDPAFPQPEPTKFTVIDR